MCDDVALFIIQKPYREEALKRVQKLDFRLEGPPLKICDLCGEPFADWTMTDGAGQVHPPDP
jgi:hypothetical protein